MSGWAFPDPPGGGRWLNNGLFSEYRGEDNDLGYGSGGGGLRYTTLNIRNYNSTQRGTLPCIRNETPPEKT